MISKEVSIKLKKDEATLEGLLTVPENASAVVVFAHGSGSGRFSPRNQAVASFLVSKGFGALLLDLLTSDEEEVDEVTREFRFDVQLLAERLVGVTHWLSEQPETRGLKVAYFGSSTGAAAALIAASELGNRIAAVVSRGGRPDLAGVCLKSVVAPTLLIVGAHDFGVIELNEEALQALSGLKKMTLVAGATHLFEEPGTLEQVERLAAEWFKGYCEAADSASTKSPE